MSDDLRSGKEFWDEAREQLGFTKENGYDDLVRNNPSSMRDIQLSGRDLFSPVVLRDLFENSSIGEMAWAQQKIDNHIKRQCILINHGIWPGGDSDGPVPSYSKQAAYPRSWDDYESYESSSQIMAWNVLPNSKTELNVVYQTSCGEFQPEGETNYHLVARFSEEGTRWAIAGFYQDNFDDRFNRTRIVRAFDSLKDASEWVKTDAAADRECGLEYVTDLERSKSVYESVVCYMGPLIEKLQKVGIRVETGVIAMDPPEHDHEYDVPEYEHDMELDR